MVVLQGENNVTVKCSLPGFSRGLVTQAHDFELACWLEESRIAGKSIVSEFGALQCIPVAKRSQEVMSRWHNMYAGVSGLYTKGG